MITRARLQRAVGAVSLAAAMALIWQSEWQLALAVGWPPYIAWLAPVALDAYLLAAVLAGRDVGVAVMVSAASVFVSHAVYATPDVWASGVIGDGHLLWLPAALFSAVPLLVAWRVHHLVAAPSMRIATPAPDPAESGSTPVTVVHQKPRVTPPASSGAPPSARAQQIAARVIDITDLPSIEAVMTEHGVSKRTAERDRAAARRILEEAGARP